jgi:hypothetical protein
MVLARPQSIQKQIADALGLPDKVVGFVLTCRVNQETTVEVEYYPQVDAGKLPQIKREQWILKPKTRGDNGE